MQISKDLMIKIGLGIAAAIVVIAILSFVFQIAMTLAPFAILAIVAYFGYRWLSSRKPEKVLVEEKTEAVQQQRYEENLASANRTRTESRPTVVIADANEVEKTGFGEAPDISRLEEKEKEAPQITDDVRAQIEERRRRLGMDD